jgi:hypothetical protein
MQLKSRCAASHVNRTDQVQWQLRARKRRNGRREQRSILGRGVTRQLKACVRHTRRRVMERWKRLTRNGSGRRKKQLILVTSHLFLWVCRSKLFSLVQRWRAGLQDPKGGLGGGRLFKLRLPDQAAEFNWGSRERSGWVRLVLLMLGSGQT